MSTLTRIADHADRMVALMLSHFSRALVVRRFVEIVGEEVQALEDVVFAAYAERTLEAAAGAQLDQYGRVLALARNGLTDNDYRAILRVKIRAHRASGRINEILDVAELVLEPAGPVIYLPLYPAAYGLAYTVGVPISADRWQAALRLLFDMRPAGVDIAEFVETGDDSFAWLGFEHDDSAAELGVGYLSRVVHPIHHTWPFPVVGLVAVWQASGVHLADGAPMLALPPVVAGSESGPIGGPGSFDVPMWFSEMSHLWRPAVYYPADHARYVTRGSRVFWRAGESSTVHIRVCAEDTGTTDPQVAISQFDGGASLAALTYKPSEARWIYEEPGGVLLSAPGVGLGESHTLTVVRDVGAAVVSLYIDGELADTDTIASDPPDEVTRIGALRASGVPADDMPLCGHWTTIAVYDKAQSADELETTWLAIDATDGRIPT